MGRKEAGEGWIDLQKEEIDEISEIVEKNEKIRYFFDMNEDIFETESKKRIFLEGVIREYLMNKQEPGREVTPLKRVLDSFDMDEEQSMILLPLLQRRLEKEIKRELKKEGSFVRNAFGKEGKSWRLTNREIGFYYGLGVNFFSIFLRKEREEEREKSVKKPPIT